MTQEDLARAVGLKTKAAISKIEKGITNPNQIMISKIADALKVSPTILFGYYSETIEEFLPYLSQADETTLDNIRAILGMPRKKKICDSIKETV